MPKFNYQAITDSGESISGSIQAKDRQFAIEEIEKKDLYICNLQRVNEDKKNNTPFFSFRSKKEDLILFTRQLSNLLAAEIQLGEALQIIIRILKPGKFRNVVKDIYDSIKSGQDFAESLKKHPEYFSSAYVNMIKAGEESGLLGLTSQRIMQNLERRKEIRSFIISSLIYPLILLIVAALALLVIFTYVLPKFAIIYNDYGQSLPWATEVLLRISSFFSSYGLIIIVILLTFIIGIWIYYQTESGRREIDRVVLKLPVVGGVIRDFIVIQITRSLGSMLDSGVALLKALKIIQQITGNMVFKDALVEASLEIKKGSKLAEVFGRSNIFPEVVVYMIEVGERTGKLEAMLLQIADNFEEDSKKSLERMMNLFEPVVILIMGIIIGFVVIAMLLPILGINTISL